jgi:hypothetical protein
MVQGRDAGTNGIPLARQFFIYEVSTAHLAGVLDDWSTGFYFKQSDSAVVADPR